MVYDGAKTHQLERPSFFPSFSLFSLGCWSHLNGPRCLMTTICTFQQQRRRGGYSSTQRGIILDTLHISLVRRWSCGLTSLQGRLGNFFLPWVAVHPAKHCISMAAGERQSAGAGCDSSVSEVSQLHPPQATLLFLSLTPHTSSLCPTQHFQTLSQLLSPDSMAPLRILCLLSSFHSLFCRQIRETLT